MEADPERCGIYGQGDRDGEVMADGLVERDPETGRIVKSVLSSERAKEIRAMKKDTNPLAESDVETLIIEGGYDLEDAPL